MGGLVPLNLLDLEFGISCDKEDASFKYKLQTYATGDYIFHQVF